MPLNSVPLDAVGLGAEIAVQLTAALIGWDIYRRRRLRRHLVAAVALSLMVGRRITALLLEFGIDISADVGGLDRLIFPLIISLLWLGNRIMLSKEM